MLEQLIIQIQWQKTCFKDKNAQDLQNLNNTQPEVYAPASADPEGKYGNATSAKTKRC